MGFDFSIIWILLGLLVSGLVFWLPSIEVLLLGAGALFTGLLALVIPGFKGSLFLQIMTWAASSGTMLIFLRKRFAHVFKGKLIGKDRDENIGTIVTVLEDITPDRPGRIKHQGTSWKAVSYDETYKKGEKVEILKEENLTFVVTRPLMDEYASLEDKTEE